MGALVTRCCRGKHNRRYQTDITAVKTNMAVLSQNSEPVLVGNHKMGCYAVSLPGYNHVKKPNQDRVLVHYDEATRSLIVGVFDGHGKDGHLVAHFIRDKFLHCLLTVDFFKIDALSALHFAIKKAEEEIIQIMPAVCNGSGTTVAVVILRDNKLYAINVGDSRLLWSYYDNDKYVAESISTIHCPEREDERKRIEMLGGKVRSLRLANGEQSVARVYNKAGDLGGLAMSRSVGDFYLQRYGVISEPDLYEREVVDQTIGILIGTDGLTTSCGMSTIFSTILEERSPHRGLKKLAKKCYQQMMDCSDRQYVDDISGVYVQIHPISNYPNTEIWIDRIPLSQSPL